MNAGRVKQRRKVLWLEPRWTVWSAALAMVLVMPAGLLTAPPATAERPNAERPKVEDQQVPVKGRNLKARPRKADGVKSGPPAKAAWPEPGSAEVTVPAGASARAATDAAGERAGDLPVKVLAPREQKAARDTAEPAGKVRVQMLDRATGLAAGVDGVAFTVARTDAAAPGRVRLQLDYSQFEQAFGGAYGARLRLMQLPHCALTTPSKPECSTPIPLDTANDGEGKTLTAEVEAAPATDSGSPAVASAQATATLLAVAADSGGSQGDYKATSLESSATWSGGGNTGDFTWSYPMRVPPVPGGLTPNVALAYSSSSVDGRTSNTNGQPSWVGEGFDLWPGFIERRYKACEDDGAPKDQWGNSPGDLCWGYDNATVTWNGKGGELVKAADGTWRLKSDDGTKFEKLTSSSNNNGDDNGEYWKVTTTDGTQYFFGLNRAPGWTSGKPETNSTWTVPVFGDDSGEPCHASTFAASWCQQAYRWNLDYVVDRSGNAILYTYSQETNHYGRNLKPQDETPYVRGGYLKTISYGLRSNAVFANAPAQVTFTTSERCIPTSSFDCAPSKIGNNPDHWWDVPWDLNCNAGQECKDTHGTLSPTFWSRKRLTEVKTQIIKSDGSGYRPVDSWSLDHKWGLAGIERDLLLKEIQHIGHAATDGGGTVTLPKVTFAHIQLPNRLDESGDDILAYIRYRISAIHDESGGQLDVSYSNTDCSRSNLPTPETNTTRCMPVIWTPPGHEDPITDWFHKYVVTRVTQIDKTGLSPHMTTRYQYLGGAAWHFADDDGLTKEKEKTWSQWRGYGHVRTLTGDPADPATQADTYYMRGMDGDRKNKSGGEKTVTVSDGEGGNHTDHNALAGFELKTVQYTEPGGSVHAKMVNTPWRVQTASRNRSWGTVTANVVRTDTTRTWTAKDGGGWLETKTDTDYVSSGPGVGRPTSINDLGDVTTDDDDKCTRTTYADNNGAWMVSFPSRVETVSVACTATADRPDDVVSDERIRYDGGGFGDAPTKGHVTTTEKVADYDGGTPQYVVQQATVYDDYGRPTQVTDAEGRKTTTAYTDTRGLNTKVVSTTPPADPGNSSTALTTEKHIDPAWGEPVAEIDKSNHDRRIDRIYDGLGRLTEVWLPDRTKGVEDHPNYEFAYRVVDGEIVAITTKTLVGNGGAQRVSQIDLLDGLLRPRQTQVPGQTGRLISDTFYDDRGQVVKNYDAYPATGAPQPELFGVGTPGAVEQQTHITYDGLGRKTVKKAITGNGEQPEQELWRTTYSYGGGNRVSVTPPAGGIPTTEISNALGQVIERRKYHAATPTGDHDSTTFTYTPAGEIATVTDSSGNQWTTTYDLRGRTVKTTDPDKGTTTFAYDDLDRLVSSTDARGKTLHTSYDGLDRKTAVREGGSGGTLLTSWTYDSLDYGKGELASSTRHTPNGDYTTYISGYDKLGRTKGTATLVPPSQGPLAGVYLNSVEYNADGTVAGRGLSAAGGLPSESLVYTYDDLQRPTRMATTVTSTNTAYVADVDYTATDQPQLIEHGAENKRVWQTFQYQYGTRRLDRAATTREGVAGKARDAVYHYTDAGTITSITDTSHDGVDNQCFTYDHLQRLTQAWTQSTTTCAAEPTENVIGGPAPYWHTYTYDTAGNRTGETRHGIGGEDDTVRTYTYATPGNGNRLTTVAHAGPTGNRSDSYGYDAAGNTTAITTTTEGATTSTQTFDWNSEGDLAKVTENGNDVTYVYGADGERLIRQDPGGTTLYLPDGTELRRTAGSNAVTGTRYYSFGDQTIAMRTSDGAVTYMAVDHQGTAQLAVNAATQQSTVRRFTPFGAIRDFDEDATWPGERGFVDGTQDPTGLTNLGAREYDPETGRFISVDPIMELGDEQSYNGYIYAGNSPISKSDPSGLCWSGSPACDGVRHINGDSDKQQRLFYPGFWPERRQTTRQKSAWSPVQHLVNSGVIGIHSSGGGVSRKPVRKCGFVCNMTKVNNFLYGFGSAATKATSPFGALLMVPGVEDSFANWGGMDVGSSAWKAGGWTFDISTIFMGGGGFARVAGKGGLKLFFRNLLRKCRSNSFVPGTMVLMAGGAKKAIQNLKVGDEVLATDPETGETTTEPVLATITGEGEKDLVQITIDTDSTSSLLTLGDTPNPGSALLNQAADDSDGSGVVVATANHPFWVAGDISEWVEAADLEPGMWLRTSAGTYVQVSATEHETAQDQRVHNLTIANHHTYYVLAGAASVLVHNRNGCSVPRNEKGQFTSGENADAARGRQTHLNYRNALGDGYVYDYKLPSGRRPDAIDWENRIVRELKSDANSSQALGRRKLRIYVAELEAMTGQRWTGHLDTYRRFG